MSDTEEGNQESAGGQAPEKEDGGVTEEEFLRSGEGAAEPTEA
jgi:hypothetical protein